MKDDYYCKINDRCLNIADSGLVVTVYLKGTRYFWSVACKATKT